MASPLPAYSKKSCALGVCSNARIQEYGLKKCSYLKTFAKMLLNTFSLEIFFFFLVAVIEISK